MTDPTDLLLEKLLKLKPSIKLAFVGLTAAFLTIVCWDKSHEIFIRHGFSDTETLLICLFITALIISYLLIELAIKSITSFKKTKAIKIKNNEFRATVQKSLPMFSASRLDILKGLSLGEQNLRLRQKEVSSLNKQNYIQNIHQISLDESVFKINPIVKDELGTYLKKTRTTNLTQFASSISKHERQFLSLFFSDKILTGTQESGITMEHAIYSASESLRQNKIIKQSTNSHKASHVETFELEPDAIKILEESVFHKAIKRHILELDLNYIASSGLSGGGARNSK